MVCMQRLAIGAATATHITRTTPMQNTFIHAR
jgi:hypothetical protein